MATLKLFLITCLFLSTLLVGSGDEVACGKPGEDNWLCSSEVGVVASVLADSFAERILSESMENLLSSDVTIGVLNRTLEKFGMSHLGLGHIHDASELARLVKSVVDIPKQSL